MIMVSEKVGDQCGGDGGRETGRSLEVLGVDTCEYETDCLSFSIWLDPVLQCLILALAKITYLAGVQAPQEP